MKVTKCWGEDSTHQVRVTAILCLHTRVAQRSNVTHSNTLVPHFCASEGGILETANGTQGTARAAANGQGLQEVFTATEGLLGK